MNAEARRNVTQKLVAEHLVDGALRPGEPVALRIDQTLTQDATGTLVMLTLEALDLDRARTELSAQYIDHNLIQEDHRNPDDHLFLLSAARRFGLWCARPGSGVSHPLHMRYFGRPGASLLGSDSHTCAAGSLGMLAMGAGGLDVAMAIAGQPYRIAMPEVWGVRLTGALPDRVSAKDVILEMLRRHGVSGGSGRIVEYHGPGLAALSAMDRHVIANMGQELGHVTTVFPSDAAVRRFLEAEGRGDAWREIVADQGAGYEVEDEIDLSALEPLIARPSSPGNVVPVREVAGEEIYQSYIGSSANPGFRDFAVVAEMVRGRTLPPQVSLDVNPATRDLVADLGRSGHLFDLLAAGARLHQAGCNGCIGMGQAPATGRNSLRTVPRNFPGRSGTREDSVFLCSPETAAASALAGRITDPRDVEAELGDLAAPQPPTRSAAAFVAPLPPDQAAATRLVKGPNIRSLPELDPLPDEIDATILLVAHDDISTDEILPAGAEVLPFRSNIQRIADFAFRDVDPDYVERARQVRDDGGHAIVGGRNYGQGSSREHAVLAPRYLGLRVTVAESYARIHRRNLINFGVLPLTLCDPEDRSCLSRDARLRLSGVRDAVAGADAITSRSGSHEVRLGIDLSPGEREVLAAGGLVNWFRAREARNADGP
jgi:aconitate hydratase